MAEQSTWEIDSICLYVGCGVPGRSGPFYAPSDAYQTLNLLMMEGLEGERVRVCAEGQYPDPIYIREWPRTLAVFTDIFRAQCRYHRLPAGDKPALPPVLYRGDRKLNTEELRRLGRTFAFTSLSKKGFLPSFAVGKQHPALLEVTLDSACPCLDLAAVLKEHYKYPSEAELLLPPFVRAEVSGGEPLTEEQAAQYRLDGGGPVLFYRVRFGGFCPGDGGEDPGPLIRRLERDKGRAARVLEAIRDSATLDALTPEELQCYTGWKQSFSRLVHIHFRRIWAKALQSP